MKKPSFLERLTGATAEDDYSERDAARERRLVRDTDDNDEEENDGDWHEDASVSSRTPQEGELPVDMFQTNDAIVIRALVAGVPPSDLDIAITRDMVTIRGLREEVQETHDDNYHNRELFWGSFSRSILLPEEIVIDEAEAQEKHGMLEIRLPKLDKQRSTQLRVKSNVIQK